MVLARRRWRLDAMHFTTPIISDVGISMVMRPTVPTMWGKSQEIVTPFTTEVRALKRLSPPLPPPLLRPYPHLPAAPAHLSPCRRQMWGLTAMTLVIVALVMWISNHGGTIDTKM